jgi:hypothetical protein
LTGSRSSGCTTTLSGPTGRSSLAPTGELRAGLGDLAPVVLVLSFVVIDTGGFLGVRAMRYGFLVGDGKITAPKLARDVALCDTWEPARSAWPVPEDE